MKLLLLLLSFAISLSPCNSRRTRAFHNNPFFRKYHHEITLDTSMSMPVSAPLPVPVPMLPKYKNPFYQQYAGKGKGKGKSGKKGKKGKKGKRGKGKGKGRGRGRGRGIFNKKPSPSGMHKSSKRYVFNDQYLIHCFLPFFARNTNSTENAYTSGWNGSDKYVCQSYACLKTF